MPPGAETRDFWERRVLGQNQLESRTRVTGENFLRSLFPKEGGDNFKNRHSLWLIIHKLNGKSQTIGLSSGTLPVQRLASRPTACKKVKGVTVPPRDLDFVVST